MNSTITDITHCQICFNLFGSKEKCPRILSCGHTFCHSCLQRFISDGSVCPTCKNDIPFLSADDTLINYSVKSLSETASKGKGFSEERKDTLKAASLTDSKESLDAKKFTKKNELPYDGHCEEHCLPNHFKCMKCNKYICGTCIYLFHMDCPKPLTVLEALNLIKREKLNKIKVFKTKLEKEATMLDSKLDHLSKKQAKLYQEIKNVKSEIKETKTMKKRNLKLYKDSSCHEESLEKATCNEDYEKVDAKVKFFLEENCVDILFSPSILSKEDALKLTRKDLEVNTFYLMNSDDEEKKYAKVKFKDAQISFEEWENEVEEGSFCIDILDFISSRTSVIDTHKFIKEHKKELYYPKLPKDRIKFSKIEVKERDVYFHSFETLKKSNFVLEFGNLLKFLGCLYVVPAEAFIKTERSLEEIVITTDKRSPRALNFLLLASGIMNDFYEGTQFRLQGSVVIGGNKRDGNRWNWYNGVVKGIQDGGIYERKKSKTGDVEGRVANASNSLSAFGVGNKNYSTSSSSSTTFGRIKRGMKVIDQIEEGDQVKECSLFFNLL